MSTTDQAVSPADVDLDGYWRALVTAALLGTDRREPPPPPPGPIADVVADSVRPDGASRLLAAVAATAAARRAAFVPTPPAGSLQPPSADDRPWCSPAAMAAWRVVVAEWPVLEDEWVLTVVDQGLRLPPDGVAELLIRHRSDVTRRARVALAAGPVGAWVAEHVPAIGPTGAAGSGTVSAAVVTSLPELPVPVELADLLGADAHSFCRRLAAGFDAGFGPAHKAVLVNLLARCRPAVLLDAAEVLDAQRVGLALALADLARLRHRMLVELGATP